MEQVQSLFQFLVVSNFGGFTTLLAGSVAWLVYAAQKSDKKINAARVLLAEIRGAEKRIDEIAGLLDRKQKEFPSILPANSWKNHSYLFASDFDQDELDEINEFYGLCERVDDAARKDNNFFWLTTENISRAGQDMAAKIISESITKNFSLDSKKLAKLTASVLDNISKNPFMYSPQKTLDTITLTVQKIKKITTNTTGTKLKSFAYPKKRLF